MTDEAQLPSLPANEYAGSPGLAIWFNNDLFERARLIASYIAKAEGVTPAHLLGKNEACFMVVERALTWKLSPSAVAMSTYQTPGGKVGFEGRLCQAIVENSGKVEGGVRFEHFYDVVIQDSKGGKRTFRSNSQDAKEAIGDGGQIIERRGWDRVQGKHKLAKGSSGKDYPVAAWKPEDEAGLGVTVSCQVRGEADKRTLDIELVQAFPRNSTLWALDPKTQLCYLAVRRFASVAVPGLFMGVPFDREEETGMRDVTPARPVRGDFIDAEPSRPTKPVVTDVEPDPIFDLVSAWGEPVGPSSTDQAYSLISDYCAMASDPEVLDIDAVAAFLEHNEATIEAVCEALGGNALPELVSKAWASITDRRNAAQAAAAQKAAMEAEAAKAAKAAQVQPTQTVEPATEVALEIKQTCPQIEFWEADHPTLPVPVITRNGKQSDDFAAWARGVINVVEHCPSDAHLIDFENRHRQIGVSLKLKMPDAAKSVAAAISARRDVLMKE